MYINDSKGLFSDVAYWDVASEMALGHVNINWGNIQEVHEVVPEQSYLEAAISVDAPHKLQHIIDH